MKYALAVILSLVAAPAFAVVNLSIDSLVDIVLYLIIVGGVCWLLLFLVSYWGVPEPFAKVAKGVIMTVAVMLLIGLLLGFVGHPVVQLR